MNARKRKTQIQTLSLSGKVAARVLLYYSLVPMVRGAQYHVVKAKLTLFSLS